jgi:hypothetical protein
MTQQPVSERIKILLDKYANGNKSELGRAGGVSGQAIADLIEGKKGGPSFPVLQKLLRSYPDVNPEWLIHGDGEMLKSPPVSSIAEEPQNNSSYKEAEKPAVREFERGASAEHQGRKVPTFRRIGVKGLPLAGDQPAGDPPGMDLIRQVAKNTAEIENMRRILDMVVAEMREQPK